MRKPTKSGKLKGKSKKKGSKKKKSKSRDPSEAKKLEVDILSPAAMLNAQYICHDVSDCLEKRGFPWPGGSGKGKKGKGKKKRKKKK